MRTIEPPPDEDPRKNRKAVVWIYFQDTASDWVVGEYRRLKPR